MTGSKITVRPLTEADFELLFVWLNEPHLVPFYQREPVTAEQVEQKYRPRLRDDHPTSCLIAEAGGMPFGYVQWYVNRAYPDYGVATLGEPDGVSFDYYVGSRDHLGRRLGSDMLVAAVQHVKPHLAACNRLFFVRHRADNDRAIRCSNRAGFAARKTYVEGGREHVLLRRDERKRRSLNLKRRGDPCLPYLILAMP